MGGYVVHDVVLVARNHERHEGLVEAIMRIQLSAPLEVAHTDRVANPRLLYGRQGRIAFAMLVLERRRPVPREELAEVLWPDGPPRTWGSALRGVVSNVRGYLAAAGLPDGVSTNRGPCTYQLMLPDDVWVDVEAAESAVHDAARALHAGSLARAILLAENARDLADRLFLPDADGGWVNGVRKRMWNVRHWAQCVLSEACTRRGQHELALRAAEQAIELEPFRERNHRLLMRAHAAAGNRAESLRAYERCRQLLADELGVEPAVETTGLHLALMHNQPPPDEI